MIDVDSAAAGTFDAVDQHYLEALAALLADGCDWM